VTDLITPVSDQLNGIAYGETEENVQTWKFERFSPKSTLVETPNNRIDVWMEQAKAKIANDPTCIESLYLAALKFLEQHLRSRLNIAEQDEVRIGFDPQRTRPSSSWPDEQELATAVPAHGLPASLPLEQLYAEFRGAQTSMKTITLFEDSKGRSVDGWNAIATVCVDYLQDRWCVNAILVWGEPGTQQAEARDLFISTMDVQNLKPQQLSAYQNSLETEYRLPYKV